MEKKNSANSDFHTDEFIKARALVGALKTRHMSDFLRDPNIIGAAFGRRIAHGEITKAPALVVYVARKVSSNYLPLSRMLPRKMYIGGDYVEVDVVETGPLYPLTFNAQETPATLGISIGNANEASAGTLGALVIDKTDKSLCILSNNHVMARENAALIGEMIVQPGVYDGGSSPANDIATLKRFITINSTGNTVDCAIASILKGAVINQVHNNLIPVASSDHPAVGLLFAGGCNRMIMNPIANVLSQLNIDFPNPNAIVPPDIGMNVEKVGRTTEYTTSTILEIDATVTLGYNFGNATFDHQITTAWMDSAGDSGSLVYKGGAGGNVDQCSSCGSTSSAATKLGVNLDREQNMAKIVRDQFLRHTQIGRWAVDLFYANEERALERLANTNIQESDRAYARKIYDKYHDEAISVFAQGETSEKTLTEQHFKDIDASFKRAQKYLEKDEIKAGEKLLVLAKKHGLGKNVRKILALLNNIEIAKQLEDIMREVKFIKHNGDCCK